MIYTSKTQEMLSFSAPSKARQGRKLCLGVTLIELLITISIVMVLASLLVPIIGWVKQWTQQNACQNNLRQLGAAVWTYAQLNGDLIPASRSITEPTPEKSLGWFYRLPPLMNGRTINKGGSSFFQCPLFSGENPGILNNEVAKSYKMNSKIDYVESKNGNKYIPFRLNRISDSRDVVLFVDGITKGGSGQWGYAYESTVDDSRHRGWVSVLFADGRTTRIIKKRSGGWKGQLQWESVDWK
jgi:prepilin-type processing-associated H-X9-DG protein